MARSTTRGSTPRSHPCAGYTAANIKCGNVIANPKQQFCGQCTGARTEAQEATAVASLTGLRKAADRDASSETSHVRAVANTELLAQPTAKLVADLSSTYDDVVHACARASRSGDPAEAERAIRRQAALEDAILVRHADPYGAAMLMAAKEVHDPGEEHPDAVRIRRWIADTPDAPADQISHALNTLAQGYGAMDPWLPHLNWYAATRAAHLRNPGDPGLRLSYEQAEAGWKQVRPDNVETATA